MAKKRKTPSSGIRAPKIKTIDTYLAEAYKNGTLDPKFIHEIDSLTTKLDPPDKWKK